MSKRTRKHSNVDALYNALTAVTGNKPSNRQTLTDEIATRARSIDFVSSVLDVLPNPDPVLRKKGIAISTYETLFYDSRVKAVANSRKAVVKSQEWDVIPGDEPVSEDILSFYRNVFASYGMTDLIGQILDAWVLGYKPIEILWATPDSKIVPVGFVPKPSEWFVYDGENRLRMRTRDNPFQGMEVPPNRFIVARNEASFKNPYGVAVMSACFWPVTFRHNGLRFWTVFLEKYGTPFLLAHAEEGAQAERIQEIATLLEDMIHDAIAVIPKNYEMSILEAKEGKSGSDSFHKAYLDFMNLEIEMAVLSTNLTTEVTGGSYAAAQSHMVVRDDIIESDANIVEAAFNELIAITHSFNFGGPKPKFKLFSEEKIDAARAERDLKLSQTGVKFTPHYYQRAYNLTEEDFILETEVTEPVSK